MPTSIRSLARALAAVVAPLIIIVANDAEAAAGNTPPPFAGMGYSRGYRRRAPLFAATTSMRRRIAAAPAAAAAAAATAAAAVEGDVILSVPRGGGGDGDGDGGGGGGGGGGEHNKNDDDDANRGVHGGNISPSTTTSSPSSSSSSSSSSREEGGGAWEEEIRRAREFYAAASSSSPSLPRSETILVADVDDLDDVDADDADADDADDDDADVNVDADDAVANPDADDVDANADADADAHANADADDVDADANADDAHTTTDNVEDERVLGNYQTAVASHDVRGDRGEIMEEEHEQAHEPSEEESMPGSEAVGDDVTSSAGGATDASGNEQDGTIAMIRGSAVDAPCGQGDDGVYAQDVDGIAHEEGLKGEEATLAASLESDPEEGSYDVDEGDGGLVAAEEHNFDEEDSDGVAVGMNDVATAISEEVIVQDENADSANNGHHVEDNNQGVSHVSNIALNDANLLLPQRWERASRATASNTLIEEGLHRLQRRDGDHPSVPYVITRAMQRVLVDELGYAPTEVNSLRPDVAIVIVAESLERPDLESLPPRFYRDAEPYAVVEGTSGDKSFKEAALKLTHRIRKLVSTSFVSSHTKKAMPIILASLGVGLSLLFSSNNSNEKSPDGTVHTYEFQSINDASQDNRHIALSGAEELVEEDDASPVPELQPDDLDKTWLDTLISFVSKLFGV